MGAPRGRAFYGKHEEVTAEQIAVAFPDRPRVVRCGGRADQHIGLKTRGWQFVVMRGEDEYLAAFASKADADLFVRASVYGAL